MKLIVLKSLTKNLITVKTAEKNWYEFVLLLANRVLCNFLFEQAPLSGFIGKPFLSIHLDVCFVMQRLFVPQ